MIKEERKLTIAIKRKAKQLLIQFGVSGKSDKIGIWSKIHCWDKGVFCQGSNEEPLEENSGVVAVK